jgi:NH3-dependent NAD+ synthetase
MSYCRNTGTDSDVYVILDASANPAELLTCYCSRDGEWLTRIQMIGHLYQHLAKGDKVPEHVFTRIISEILEYTQEQFAKDGEYIHDSADR